MNPIDDQINRLFRAAIQAQTGGEVAPPFGLETRVLAAWREGRAAESGFWEMMPLGRGLLLAFIIMAASFLPMLNTSTNPFADYLQLTETTTPAAEDAP